MKKIDVVLVAPNSLGSYRFRGKNRENLALGTLGAYLVKNKIPVELVDARLDHLNQKRALVKLKKFQPLVVGLTLMGDEAAVWSRKLTKELKKTMPDVHIVAGSYFPTLDPQKTFKLLPGLDSIVQGEGEETLLELTLKIKKKQNWFDIKGLAYLRNGAIIINPRRKLIAHLDLLPNPIRYAKESKISKISLEGSRGCFARCTFCSIVPHLDPQRSFWRGKSPQRIVEELIELRNQYPKINKYRFVDADFIGSPCTKNIKRVEEFADMVFAAGFSQKNTKFSFETQSKNVVRTPLKVWKKVKRAGLCHIFIGIESGSEKIKRYMRKPSSLEEDIKAINILRELGFSINYGFIMLTPYSTMDDILKNIRILRTLGHAPLDRYFSELILTPGTKSFEMAKEKREIYIERCQGADRYSYVLPNPLENIKRIGRFMEEDGLYRSFLEKVNSLYDRADSLFWEGEIKLAKKLIGQLDKINFEIFMKILKIVQKDQEVFKKQKIKKLFSNIIPNFKSQLLKLENNFMKNSVHY